MLLGAQKMQLGLKICGWVVETHAGGLKDEAEE
jgi:hypothetical protein